MKSTSDEFTYGKWSDLLQSQWDATSRDSFVEDYLCSQRRTWMQKAPALSKTVQSALQPSVHMVRLKSVCSVLAMGYLEDMVGSAATRRLWDYADGKVGASYVKDDLEEILYKTGFVNRIEQPSRAVNEWSDAEHDALMDHVKALRSAILSRPPKLTNHVDVIAAGAFFDSEDRAAAKARAQLVGRMAAKWSEGAAEKTYIDAIAGHQAAQAKAAEAARQKKLDADILVARMIADRREKAEQAQADVTAVALELEVDAVLGEARGAW